MSAKKFMFFLKKKWMLAAGLSLGLLAIVYTLNNYAYPFFGMSSALTFIESRIQAHPDEIPLDTSRVFINVGYEKELVSTRHGKEVITDRGTLLRLLEDLEKKAEYKEIFVDIRFEKGLSTPSDSALVEQLVRMPNTFTVKHWDYGNDKDQPLIDDRLLENAAYGDYSNSIFSSSFSRYEFIQHDGVSAALRLYNDIYGANIKKGLFFYRDDYHKSWFCNNAAFIRIPEDMSPDVPRYRDDAGHTFRYYNLSEDIYGFMAVDPSVQENFFTKECKDKVIVIGDFLWDQHDTYYDKQPGPYLIYLAFDTLRKGLHTFPWWLVVIAFFVYFATVCLILSGKTLGNGVQWLAKNAGDKIKNKLALKLVSILLLLLASIGENGLILLIVSSILFLITGRTLSIVVPTLLFTIIECVVASLNNIECVVASLNKSKDEN